MKTRLGMIETLDRLANVVMGIALVGLITSPIWISLLAVWN